MSGPEITQVVEARFWAKVDKRGPDECWQWLGGKGSTTANGHYGRMSITHSRSRPAHQVSWEIANRAPFPAGMRACHSCDNPWCVNPKHIWPGTQAQNIQDCVAKGRHGSKRHTHCSRGHELTPANRRGASSNFRCIACDRVKSRETTRKYRQRCREATNG